MARISKPRTEAEAEAIWNNARMQECGNPKRVKLEAEKTKIKKSIRNEVSKHLDIQMLLIDEAICALVCIERMEASASRNGSLLVFQMLVSRIRSLTMCFKELIFLGQIDALRLISRSAIESVELAIACLSNEDFCEGFAPHSTEDANENEETFWKKSIGYGNIYKTLKPALVDSGLFTLQEAEEEIKIRQGWKSAFSGSVHSNIGSAFQCYFTPSLSAPGLLAFRQLGHLSAHAPFLCEQIIIDLNLLIVFFTNTIIEKTKIRHLPKFEVDQVSSFLAQAETFSFLLQKYESHIHKDWSALFPDDQESANTK